MKNILICSNKMFCFFWKHFCFCFLLIWRKTEWITSLLVMTSHFIFSNKRIPLHGVQQQHIATTPNILLRESTVWTILWGSQYLCTVQISHLRPWETLPSYLPTTGFKWLPAEADVGSERVKQHRRDMEIRKSDTYECCKTQCNEHQVTTIFYYGYKFD